jgi:hypothetical protein
MEHRQGGVDEIMTHPWFSKAKFSWTDLYAKKIKVPLRLLGPSMDPLDSDHRATLGSFRRPPTSLFFWNTHIRVLRLADSGPSSLRLGVRFAGL